MLQKLLDPSNSQIVLAPEHGGKGSWVGAPAGFYDVEEDCFYLLLRFRREDIRGYKTVLYKTKNGVDLKEIFTITKEELNAISIERGALTKNGKKWTFYLSYEDRADGLWKVAKAEKENLEKVTAEDFSVVLSGEDIGVRWVKDPVIFEGHLFVHTKEFFSKSMYLVEKRKNKWKGGKVLTGEHTWDKYCTRITTILKSPRGFFAFYDGASSIKQNREEKVGIAYGTILSTFKSVTPDGPVIETEEGSGSVRYMEIKEKRGLLYVWYEVCTEDWSHHLRFTSIHKKVLFEYLESLIMTKC